MRIGAKIRGRIAKVLSRKTHGPRSRLASTRSRLVLRALKLRIGRERPLIGIGLVEHAGDIVAAEPLVRQVRRTYPDAHIVWCVRAPYVELVEAQPVVDRALVVFCLTEWIRLKGSGVFDRAIDLHVQARVCPACKIALVRPEGNQRITMENYYEFGNLLEVMTQYTDLTLDDDQPALRISPAQRERVDRLRLPASFVAVHCSSNEVDRDWPAPRWQALARSIADAHGVPVVEIGLKPVIAASPSPGYVDLCGRLTLMETAEVIRRSVLFIGVDSGPAHLANAVSTYGIVLMGPYRAFRHHMPFSGRYKTGENAAVLYEASGLQRLEVETVERAVDAGFARRAAPASAADAR